MPFDSDEMAKEFMLQFSGLALTVGQPLVFAFHPDKPLLSVSVKGLEAVDPNAMVSGGTVKPAKTKMGLCRGNTSIQFEKAEQSGINLTGKAKGYKL
jgi:vesicle-fusing ATPase